MRPRLTYANVMSTLCFFLLLGGGAYAANRLGKNTVGTKQLKKNSVTSAKIKKGAVTGANVKDQSLTGKDINLAKLGTVPSATHAASADSIPPAEPIHLIGAPGEPAFENGAVNNPVKFGPLRFSPAGYYKDAFGIVHLEGVVKVGTFPIIFTLPPGYRPASGTAQAFAAPEEGNVIILGSGAPEIGASAGAVVVVGKTALLSGIAFRAES
jgi:hypothetical protein